MLKQTPPVFLLLSCVVNAVLDVLFVVYLDMGVEGVMQFD